MDKAYMISVIIPVYNAEKYIKKCLESVIHQTYQDLQIIIVDDGSEDSSKRICKEYADRDSRVLLIEQLHAGVSRARNNALNVVEGRFVTFVDADDWLELNAYEMIIKNMFSHNVDVVFYGYYKDREDMKFEIAPRCTGVCGRDELLSQTIVPGGYLAMCCTKMFDRKLIFKKDRSILFDESLTNGEDGLWTWTVLAGAENAYLDNTPFYHYRIRKDGTNYNQVIKEERLSELEAYKKAYDILQSVSPVLLDKIKARTFNCAHELRMKSYIQDHKKCEQRCMHVMQDTVGSFYGTSYFGTVYKLHHRVIDFLIGVHISKKFLGKMNDLIYVTYDMIIRVFKSGKRKAEKRDGVY